MKNKILPYFLICCLIVSCQTTNDVLQYPINIDGGAKLLCKYDSSIVLGVSSADLVNPKRTLVFLSEKGNSLNEMIVSDKSYMMSFENKDLLCSVLLYDEMGMGSEIKIFYCDKDTIHSVIREENASIRAFKMNDTTVIYITKEGNMVEKNLKNEVIFSSQFPYQYANYSQFIGVDEVISYSNDRDNGSYSIYRYNIENGHSFEKKYDGTIYKIDCKDENCFSLVLKDRNLYVNQLDGLLNSKEIFSYSGSNKIVVSDLSVLEDIVVINFAEKILDYKILIYNVKSNKSTIYEDLMFLQDNKYMFEYVEDKLLIWAIWGRKLLRYEIEGSSLK